MKLSDYIRGDRRGKEANRLEREALTDPFLSDALDGYRELNEDSGRRIEQLQARISARSRTAGNNIRWWNMAAVFLLLIATGTWFWVNIPVDTDFYYRLAANELLEDEPFEYNYMREFRSDEPEVLKQPVPLFAYPIPVGGEKFIEPYLPILTEDYSQLDKSILKEGEGKKPEPLIDNNSYKQYLANHIQIPIEGTCARSRGRVTVAFRVNPSGRPYDIHVVKGLCESLDNEAVRLVREGPDWKFGDQEIKMTIQL